MCFIYRKHFYCTEMVSMENLSISAELLSSMRIDWMISSSKICINPCENWLRRKDSFMILPPITFTWWLNEAIQLKWSAQWHCFLSKTILIISSLIWQKCWKVLHPLHSSGIPPSDYQLFWLFSQQSMSPWGVLFHNDVELKMWLNKGSSS